MAISCYQAISALGLLGPAASCLASPATHCNWHKKLVQTGAAGGGGGARACACSAQCRSLRGCRWAPVVAPHLKNVGGAVMRTHPHHELLAGGERLVRAPLSWKDGLHYPLLSRRCATPCHATSQHRRHRCPASQQVGQPAQA